jgi:hypothetical protein
MQRISVVECTQRVFDSRPDSKDPVFDARPKKRDPQPTLAERQLRTMCRCGTFRMRCAIFCHFLPRLLRHFDLHRFHKRYNAAQPTGRCLNFTDESGAVIETHEHKADSKSESPTISARPDGDGAASQLWILTDASGADDPAVPKGLKKPEKPPR